MAKQWLKRDYFILFLFILSWFIMIFHRTPINYLLVNLAIADALYATFVTLQTFLKMRPTHPGGITGTLLCKLVTGGRLAWVAGTSSLITLLAIAAERYYAVIYPVGNLGKFTKGKLKVSHLQKSVNTSSIYQACADILFYSNTEYTGIYEKSLQANCFLCSFTVT